MLVWVREDSQVGEMNLDDLSREVLFEALNVDWIPYRVTVSRNKEVQERRPGHSNMYEREKKFF